MGLEQARQDITAAIEALRPLFPLPATPIEYDNLRIVDTQTQSEPYIRVNCVFMDGYQADMAVNPIHRKLGQIHLAVAVKEGKGSAAGLRLLDLIYPQLQGKRLGIVRTKFAKFAPPHLDKGWTNYPVLIPFWFDETFTV